MSTNKIGTFREWLREEESKELNEGNTIEEIKKILQQMKEVSDIFLSSGKISIEGTDLKGKSAIHQFDLKGADTSKKQQVVDYLKNKVLPTL